MYRNQLATSQFTLWSKINETKDLRDGNDINVAVNLHIFLIIQNMLFHQKTWLTSCSEISAANKNLSQHQQIVIALS